ncbi:hypothetical protein AB6H17_04490 [Proteus vulgaris]|uniref:hypothetical protein n=1 Tax=Proteus vulgaris TaxID=585 RepID=UPI0034DD4CEB
MPLVSLRCINDKALAVKAYAKKVGTPVIRYPKLARKIYHKYHLFESYDRLRFIGCYGYSYLA